MSENELKPTLEESFEKLRHNEHFQAVLEDMRREFSEQLEAFAGAEPSAVTAYQGLLNFMQEQYLAFSGESIMRVSN